MHRRASSAGENSMTDIPIESLLGNDRGATWLQSLEADRGFVEQIEQRQRLVAALQAVQSRAPDPRVPLDELLSQEILTEEQVADLYESLADMLEQTPEYGRIVLYLPFAYLLRRDFAAQTERLAQQASRFKNSYMNTWRRLLSVRDVRANFVDGDVLETQLRDGDLPRVVKAAHLVPSLVQKGWLTVGEVTSMHDASEDEVLRESIADTFGVLRDLGFVEDQVAAKFGNFGLALTTAEKESLSAEPAALRSAMDARLENVEGIAENDTPKRRTWLAEVHRQKVVESAGDAIAESLREGLLSPSMLVAFISTDHAPSQLAFIDGLRKELERFAMKDVSSASALYRLFHEPMRQLWERNDPATQAPLQKLFFRLYHAGVIDRATLRSLGLTPPSIGGPFSENLRGMETETREVEGMIDAIRRDPILGACVYPVVLRYGSRIKGYGAKNADVDLGVFLKPSTPDDVKTSIRGRLATIFTTEKHQDPVTEFWLDEDNNGMSVHDFGGHDVALGDSMWPHVLFGAAWTGDPKAIRELYERLLPGYFRDNGEQLYGHSKRAVYLESLEQDLLQYRLMHKGYERYFPTRNAVAGLSSDRMDGRSAFYDSGYRAMATKLFAERVFLPKL